MTKKLIFTFTALAMMMLTYSPARVDYRGCIIASAGYSREVTTTGNPSLTILIVTNRGKLGVDDIPVFSPSPEIQSRTIPRHAVRMIFKADNTRAGTPGIPKFSQGANGFEVPIDYLVEADFDISPGPMCEQ